MSTHPSICRLCPANCGILVEVENGRPVRIEGDREDPIFQGYTCAKGRQLPAQHAHPERLLHSMKRSDTGVHQPIESQRALEEVAEKIAVIVEQHGPRSVALYIGTLAGSHPTAGAAAVGWLLALGSRMVFTAASIDQPGKNIANALHGRWLGGPYLFDESDAWLIVGANPVISGTGGISSVHSARRIRAAKKRGARLVVIDPRRSESARFADLHLQPRPGEDPALLAAMLHVIMREELFDRSFVTQNADGFEALARAVEPFDPATSARRADVPAADIEAAARIFATGSRGCAMAGTGPNMSGHGNLSEYLVLCLNTVCGYWRSAGEVLPNPGVLTPPATPKAQAAPPRRAWGYGEKLRIRGFTNAASGLPTSALADEILLEGEGQIRALVCVGGNPAVAWPDQRKALKALNELELCVTLDIKMSATARHADYVIAPKLSLEVPTFSLHSESYEQSYIGVGYAKPYGRYAPALVDPPSGSDLIEEWEFFYGLAQRMGLALRFFPVRPEVGALRGRRQPIDFDMQRKPSTDELYEQMAKGSRVSLAEVKKHTHGALFQDETVCVKPRDPDCDARLELGDKTMLAELRSLLDDSRAGQDGGERFPFRLISRRMPNVYNSSAHDLPALHRRRRYNPAFLHPADLDDLGITAGDVVTISSDHDSVPAIVEAAPELRRGMISMAHCFGDVPERDAELFEIGSNTSRLVSVERNYDPYTGIPLMSGLPVAVHRTSGPLRDTSNPITGPDLASQGVRD